MSVMRCAGSPRRASPRRLQDKFPTAVPPLDPRRQVTAVQVQRCQNRASAQPFVFVIPTPTRMPAWSQRQVGSDVGDRLHSGLFVDRNRDHPRRRAALAGALMLQGHFPVHQQNFPHLGFEIRIATLPLVFHLLRVQGGGVADFRRADRAADGSPRSRRRCPGGSAATLSCRT